MANNNLDLKAKILVLQRDVQKLKEDNKKAYDAAPQYAQDGKRTITKQKFVTMEYKIKDMEQYINELVQFSQQI